jgi:hypothetical protein
MFSEYCYNIRKLSKYLYNFNCISGAPITEAEERLIQLVETLPKNAGRADAVEAEPEPEVTGGPSVSPQRSIADGDDIDDADFTDVKVRTSSTNRTSAKARGKRKGKGKPKPKPRSQHARRRPPPCGRRFGCRR